VKDDIPTDRVPVLTLALIVANLVVFLLVDDGAVARHGLVPDDPTVATAFTSMFLHAGWLHLLGNMLFLWLFGPNVEDSLGRVRFLAFYLVGGLIASAAQIAVDPSSTVPLVGASGAISALMGAYLRLYPWARVLTVVFCILFFTIVEIPVILMLVIWFGLQVVLGLLDPGDVAYVAHLAGFAFGLLTARWVATRVKTPESMLRRGRTVWQ
jgi:membrane associated rhomboid family serine protease